MWNMCRKKKKKKKKKTQRSVWDRGTTGNRTPDHSHIRPGGARGTGPRSSPGQKALASYIGEENSFNCSDRTMSRSKYHTTRPLSLLQ